MIDAPRRVGMDPYRDIRITLELAGYDAGDALLVKRAVRAGRLVMRERRRKYASTGILHAMTRMHLSHAQIGEWMGGTPRSTIQAMASGCLPERLTKAQRDGLRGLLLHMARQIKEAMDALG